MQDNLREVFAEVISYFRDQNSLRKLYKKAEGLYLLKSFKIE